MGWAFSTTGSTEGRSQIANGQLISLSEQQLVDCDTRRDHGCGGGLMDYGFEYIQSNGGIDTEDDYRYTARDGSCDKTKEAKHVVTVTGYKDVPQNDPDQLRQAVSQGPVSIAIEADKSSYQLYNGGVFDATTCGTNLDHGVLVVGYGSDGGQDYWKVKNSWGASWGEQGYIRLVKGRSPSQCGILLSASQPQGCSKGPSPGPGPSGSPYGPPTNGACPTGQVLINSSIDGDVSGEFCAPMCDSSTCPNAPSNMKGVFTSCGIYSYSTQHLYCGAFCNPQSTNSCDPANGMTCKTYGGYTGLCSYD